MTVPYQGGGYWCNKKYWIIPGAVFLGEGYGLKDNQSKVYDVAALMAGLI